MKIGYIRVSKHEQNEALQRGALKEAGCEKYFNDVMTDSNFERQGLERSEEHTSELQSQSNLVCRLLLEKNKFSQCALFSLVELVEFREHDRVWQPGALEPIHRVEIGSHREVSGIHQQQNSPQPRLVLDI